MMKFRKQIVFLFGCIELITYLSFHFSTKQDTPVGLVSTQQGGPHVQVYLKDKDKTLLPLAISINEELSEEEQIQLMFSYMSGKQKMEGFYPLFTKECVVKEVRIQEGIAHIYFDDSVKNYKKEDELRVLEAITWGATQFHDVEQVKLYINGSAMEAMPLANTPIPSILNRSIGINHFETSTSNLHTSKTLTVFTTKNIKGKNYMVPRSRRVSIEGDTLAYSVNAVLHDVSVSSELNQPLYAQDIKIKDYQMNNGTLSLELNKNILSSDTSVKQNIYDVLVLSLSMLDNVDKVEIKVDGNIVTPKDQEEKAVSKYELLYNEVSF